MAADTYDAVVIGAGMVGAVCACALAEAGQRVLTIDARPIGSLTTGRGMGHIAVTPESPALLALTSYSRRLWQRLLLDLDPDPDYLSCGTLWIARTHDELAALHERHEKFRAAAVYAEHVSPRALASIEPNLSPTLGGALLVPADCVVAPARVAAALIEAAQRRGARTMIGFDVEHIEPGRVRLDTGQTVAARAIVVAGGYLSSRLIPGLPIRSRKGHILVAQTPRPYCFHQLIEIDYLRLAHASDDDSVAFNLQPRPNGRIWIGSSRQFSFAGEDPEPAVMERMLQRAAEYVPSIRSLRVLERRAGFRPTTSDGLPLIGPWPAMPGVYIATGHEGIGITSSTATARLITDFVVGRASEIDPAPYLPTRAGLRPAPRS